METKEKHIKRVKIDADEFHEHISTLLPKPEEVKKVEIVKKGKK